jgi:hypothetical protein
MKSFLQFLKEAVTKSPKKKKKSYLEVGHPRMKHIEGDWKHPHIELYTKVHGGSMHKTPLSSKVDAHDVWKRAVDNLGTIHANGRIDHKKKEYSAVVHADSSEREPHPKVIRKAYDDVHKHMQKNHPDYTGHEQGHQLY